MSELKIPLDVVEKFLHGHDDEQYIVNLEYDKDSNTIFKFKQLPDGSRVVESDKLNSFIWSKNLAPLINSKKFYKGDKTRMRNKRIELGVHIEKLDDHDHPRLLEGYKYIIKCQRGFENILNFFRFGGIDVYDRSLDNFVVLSPQEQYLISTGKRFYKGFEDYDDIDKFTFDLETEGLDPNIHKILSIGCSTNRGFNTILKCEDDTEESERKVLIDFFKIIKEIRPAIITGHNIFNFDFDFIYTRCTKLGLDIKEIALTRSKQKPIYRHEQSVKIGGETEKYTQVSMFGFSIVDTIHAAKRAQAIDSGMKFTNLKYLCKYNKINKKNRVYLNAKDIKKLWRSDDIFYFDDNTGTFCKERPAFERLKFITRETVQANKNKIFVFGDNDEKSGFGGQAKEMRGEPNSIGIPTKKSPNNKIESFYNDDEFEDNKAKIDKAVKLILTEVQKGKTIVFPEDGLGTGLSNLEQKAPRTLALINKYIDGIETYINSFHKCDGKYIVDRYLLDDLWETQQVDSIYNQASFMLAQMLPIQYQKVCTMGTASMWKLLLLAWSYENNLAIPTSEEKRDFVGGLSRVFTLGFSRSIRKADFKSLYPSLQLVLDLFPSTDVLGVWKSILKYFHIKRLEADGLSKSYNVSGDKQKAFFYKRKQAPIKVLINASFGGISAPLVVPWAEIDIGEQIPCSGRQFLRLLVKFFIKKGYSVTQLDTDGANFMAPETGEDDLHYIGKGLNYLVVNGKEYRGVDAVIAEFNDLYMVGEMGLSLDGKWGATINLSRKNYVLLEEDGTISLTGASIKSKDIPEYINDFLNEGLLLLLNGKGYEFVKHYYSYIDKLHNREIPILKIAKKAKIKRSVTDYINRGVDKNGRMLPKQAHMELVIKNDIQVNLGDVVHYVNCGTKKSHGDVGLNKNAQMHSVLITEEMTEKPETLNFEYNIDRYVDLLNNKVKLLLIVFDKNIRHQIIISNPNQKRSWIYSELELVNNQPEAEKDQDDIILDLFTPSKQEELFWDKHDYNPNIWSLDSDIEFTLPNLNKKMVI